MDLTLITLKQQRLADFIKTLRDQESTATRYVVDAYGLKYKRDGRLQVPGLDDALPVSDAALPDMARLTGIPAEYFLTCDPKLRRLSFNYRLNKSGHTSAHVVVDVSGGTIHRIWKRNLLPAPRAPLLDAIQNSIPPDINANDVRVLPHMWNGEIDLSIISLSCTCTPLKGDVVAFGVNLSEDHKGAVQVQSAAFRLACSNGAVLRVCSNNEHRLRRPTNSASRQSEFLRRVGAFAREAWAQWQEAARGIQALPAVPIYRERYDELRTNLRNRPFFLSARIVDQVLHQIETEVGRRHSEPTAYDLWNAMTAIGSHAANISNMYSRRLRLGAGELIHHKSRTCSACRQVVFT